MTTIRDYNSDVPKSPLELTDAFLIQEDDGGAQGDYQHGYLSALRDLIQANLVNASVSGTLGVTGDATVGGTLSTPTLVATGVDVLGSGAGLEILYNSGTSTGFIQAFDRGAAAHRDLEISGAGANVQIKNTLGVTGSAEFSDNIVIGTAGKGIDFSANTGSGGETSELFDWYEEGLFTPTINFGGASVGVTYSAQVGRYTRTGDCVNFSIREVLTSKGSSTGTAFLGGLPFTVAATQTFDVASMSGVTVTFSGQLLGNVQPSTTVINIANLTEAGSFASLDNTNFANTSHILATGHYYV